MPPTATATRHKLVDAATRAFAAEGIFGASLIEVTRQAGQRNRGAIHYHFGSREGLLCAVIEPHVDFLREREGELLAVAEGRPDDDVESVVEAIVRPAVELSETGWRGRCVLVIVAELAQQDPASLTPELQAMLERTGGYEVYALLAKRMTPVDEDVENERFSLATSFILRSVADRARARDREGGRRQLELEAFTQNLIAMVAAMLRAPAPDGA
jgi:AcrR family transcriptional regulator